MTPKDIIDNLKKKNITKYRISADIKISKPTLTNWYIGKTKPDPDKFNKLVEYYHKVIKEK